MKFMVLIFVFGVVLSSDALAGDDDARCSCSGNDSPVKELEQNNPVFAGIVRSISVDSVYAQDWKVRLQVLRSFGEQNLSVGQTYEIITSRGCDFSCGYCEFKVGDPFIVYVYKNEMSDDRRVSLCSRTNRLEEAVEDLEAFGSLDLLEVEIVGESSRCGGPTNAAAFQAGTFILLCIGWLSLRRAT